MFDNVGGADQNEGSLIIGFFVGFLCCPLGPIAALAMGGRDTKIGAVMAVALQMLLACAGVTMQIIAQLARG